MIFLTLDRNMAYKTKKLTMSKWDKSKLSNDQIMYGADDALVGLQALAALTQKLGAHAVFQALESDSSAAAKHSSGKNISDSQTDRHSESQSIIKTQNLKEWTHNISPTRSKSIMEKNIRENCLKLDGLLKLEKMPLCLGFSLPCYKCYTSFNRIKKMIFLNFL